MSLDARRRFLQLVAFGPLCATGWARNLPRSPVSAPLSAQPSASVFDYEPMARQTCRAHISAAALRGR